MAIRVSILCSVMMLAACQKSPLENCISDQMAAWSAKTQKSEQTVEQLDQSAEVKSRQRQDSYSANQIDPNIWVTVPTSEEEARAAANLKCGRVYGK